MIIIGIVGAALILLAWIFETVEEVKEHKSLVDLRFAFIFIAGAAILAVYSWFIQDVVFLVLNIAIVITITFEIGYSIHVKKIHKRR